MRRRPSGSAEDEDGSKPRSVSAAGTAKKMDKENGEVTSRDHHRGGLRQSQRVQERKSSRDGANMPQYLESDGGDWPRATPRITTPTLEKRPSAHLMKAKDLPDPVPEHVRKQNARLQSPWRCSFLTLATSLSAIVLVLTIVNSFLKRQQDPKGCAMSYMMPMFAHFSDFDTEHTRFASKYSLYLYREGGVDEDTRVKGIPVLFIPGNAGSYKQVRPIAAEAAHYFHDVLREDPTAIAQGKRPLDFFTVDFNEELSAFHGQTLLDQAEYLNEAVAYILALYHNPHRSLREPGLPDPKSVIILGHSMGGAIARTMLRMPNYQEKTINTILTFAAPHARPPLSFDAAMVSTYTDVNTFWRKSFQSTAAKNPLDDVTLVSVAGGGLDIMIPSEYTSLTSLVPDTHGFTVFTSSIPNVWTGMDHLAIMWCDQFRKAIVKAIYDVVDVRRPSQTRSRPDRIQAFRKRLLTGMEPVVEKGTRGADAAIHLALEHDMSTVLSPGERLVVQTLGETSSVQAYLMPIPAPAHADSVRFTLLSDQLPDAVDGEGTLSVLFCNASPQSFGSSMLSYAVNTASNSAGTTKLACISAASDVSLLPGSRNDSQNAFDNAPPFAYLQYDLQDMSDYQFVAILGKPVESPRGWLYAEFSNTSDSAIHVNKGQQELLWHGLEIHLPTTRPLMTELKIPQVHSTLFAYRLTVARHACDEKPERFAPLVRQYIAEPYESKYFVNTQGGNINVHGLSPYMPPPLQGGDLTQGLSLQLWTDPTCNSTVDITLKVDILGSAGKLVMRYRTIFASFPILVVALVLRKQFKVYDQTGVFMSFTQSMDQCIRTSLPAIFMALTFLGVAISKSAQDAWTREWLSPSTGSPEQTVDFTINDLMLGTPDPFFWFLVPLFAIISVGICVAANYFILAVTHILALIYWRLRLWLGRAADDSGNSSNGTGTTLSHRLVTTGLLVLMVVTVIPYQFAYLALCIVQLTTCIRALRTSIADSRALASPPSLQTHNFYNYTHSIFVLMLWILPINMPVLVVWVHNLAVHWLTPFSTHHNLLAVLGYIALVEAMSSGSMVPQVTSRLRHLTNIFTFALALYAAVYGVTYAYRMHYLVNAVCMWFFAVHLSSRQGQGSIMEWARTGQLADSGPLPPAHAGGTPSSISSKTVPSPRNAPSRSASISSPVESELRADGKKRG